MNDRTSELIARLSSELKPVPRLALDRRMATALLLGAVLALALLVVSLGLRQDLGVAAGQWVLWVKLGYAAALVMGGYVLCAQAARPDAQPRWRVLVVMLPIVLVAMGALLQVVSLPVEMRRDAWLGETASRCPWLIGMLSIPCWLALSFVMRRAAPTRLRWAGFCAGLLAGAIAMFVYSLHCPETGLAFVATWYTLGMCLPAMAGAALGSWVLRWR